MNEPLKEGDRIELVAMPNEPRPIKIGTKGTVIHIGRTPYEIQYNMDWDNGRTLSLLDGVDSWKKI